MRLFILATVVMVAFAANSVLNRMAVGPGLIDPVTFAALRLVTGALALALLLAARRARGGGGFWPGRAGRLAGVAGLLVYLFAFSAAYLALDAGTGALILFGTVQLTMFAGVLLGGGALPRRRILGAALAFAGLVVLLGPSGGAIGPMLVMAAAGAGWGVYSLAGLRQTDALASTAWNFILAAPLGLVLLAALPGQATAQGVALAALSGAVTSGLGYALWYAVLPRLGGSRAAVAQLTVPLIATAGGAALMREIPGPPFWLAAALVLGGLAIANVRPRAATP